MKGEPKHFNEIKFDDTKGKESLSIHAERNLGTSVEADESHSVGGKRGTTIEKDDDLTVKSGNRTVKVEKGTQSETVKGDTSLTVEAGSRIVGVTGGIYSATASDALVLHGKGKGVSVKGEPKVFVEGTSDVELKGPKVTIGDKEVAITGTKIVLSCGGNSITIDSSGVTIFGTLVKIN
jgi:type VI secretion system secreted protein VgrG